MARVSVELRMIRIPPPPSHLRALRFVFYIICFYDVGGGRPVYPSLTLNFNSSCLYPKQYQDHP